MAERPSLLRWLGIGVAVDVVVMATLVFLMQFCGVMAPSLYDLLALGLFSAGIVLSHVLLLPWIFRLSVMTWQVFARRILASVVFAISVVFAVPVLGGVVFLLGGWIIFVPVEIYLFVFHVGPEAVPSFPLVNKVWLTVVTCIVSTVLGGILNGFRQEPMFGGTTPVDTASVKSADIKGAAVGGTTLVVAWTLASELHLLLPGHPIANQVEQFSQLTGPPYAGSVLIIYCVAAFPHLFFLGKKVARRSIPASSTKHEGCF